MTTKLPESWGESGLRYQLQLDELSRARKATKAAARKTRRAQRKAEKVARSPLNLAAALPEMIQNFDSWSESLKNFSSKIEDSLFLEDDQTAMDAAIIYLLKYAAAVDNGTRQPFSYLHSVFEAYIHYRNLTWGQVKGVLNCLRTDIQREARRAEEAVEATSRPVTQDLNQLAIRLGTYTVVLGNENDYVTIHVKTYRFGNFAGKTVAQFLSGPDNENSYTSFAFVNGKVSIWKRYAGNARLAAAIEVLTSGGQEDAGYRYALQSGNCYRCGRKLTVPASITRGLGPTCAGI